ncbi:MAG: hypothetical protein AAB394_00675 [Patescibacteria group bacterium]
MATKPSIEKLRELASRRNVAYEISRWYYEPCSLYQEVQEIQKIGFKSQAARWLESMTSAGMQFGTASKEERLKEAQSMADLAGIPLKEITDEIGLSGVLL